MKVIHVFGQPANVRYTLITGSVRDWLRHNEIPAMWSPTHRGWHVRTERVGDLIARAERDGFLVKMRGPRR